VLPHGWALVRRCGQVRYWRRPGKPAGGWSATTGFCRSADGCDLFHVFSSNAFPFRQHGSAGASGMGALAGLSPVNLVLLGWWAATGRLPGKAA
jgi:hypothetical protein